MSTSIEAGLDRPLISTQQAAERLGISYGTLRQWQADGRGPAFYRVGRHVRYTAQDLREWLEAQRVESREQ